MHRSAKMLGNLFFQTYCLNRGPLVVLDIGSQDINGSLKNELPDEIKYIGVDFSGGNNVDVVLEDPYILPFESNSIDALVCSSVFEHSDFYWVLFLELVRIIKPGGLIYINAPSNGYIHRYPVDSWRFYPDAGHSLALWATRNGYDIKLLESFIHGKIRSAGEEGEWNDFVAIFVKGSSNANTFDKRILDSIVDYSNAYCDKNTIAKNDSFYPEDLQITKRLNIVELDLVQRNNQISELEQSLRDTSADLVQRNNQISELEQSLRDTSADLVQRNNQISELEQSLRDTSVDLVQRNNQISELEQSLRDTSVDLVQRNNQISELEQSLRDTSVDLVQRNNQISELEQSLRDTSADLVQRNNQISELEKHYTIEIKKVEMMFKNSRSMRFTKPLRVLGDFYRSIFSAKELKVKNSSFIDESRYIFLQLRKSLTNYGLHDTLRKIFNKLKKVKTSKIAFKNTNKLISNLKYQLPVIDFDPLSEEFSSYQVNKKIDPKVKAIAFYLPQFHPFPENDEWWGKGFTEWTNVCKATAKFIGHNQPHRPIHLGYYDLRVEAIMEEQAKIAQEYGVYGFSYYFYWFSGKVLMELPLINMLNNKKIDIPFCLTWANENWSRRWDGQENEILISQNHSLEDSENFIRYLIKYFKDDRYIKIENKPVLIVYRANIIPNIIDITKLWNNILIENGFSGIYLIAAQTFGIRDPRPLGFDAAVEFPPHTIISEEISSNIQGLNKDFEGNVYCYNQIVNNEVKKLEPEYKQYRAAMLSWDNTARRKNNSHIMANFSIRRYKQWLSNIASCTKNSIRLNENEKFIFINAWNEWAEGTHLEPDTKYGFKYLQATYDILKNYINPEHAEIIRESQENSIAIVVHIHYMDTWEDIKKIIKKILSVHDSDIYITITNLEQYQSIKNDFPSANIELVENRGRDILPFINVLKKIIHKNYVAICKIHSKKSEYRSDGEVIRKELYFSLINNEITLEKIPKFFEVNKKLGMLVPGKYFLQHNDINMYFNRENISKVCSVIGVNFKESKFPAGSMFWARPAALQKLLKLESGELFDVEEGLADGTVAHAVERLFGLVSESSGFYNIDL
ncbi:glycoside hydrolase family 99-like domain-containing protein [Polynucleobacter asymbioticus]|uniref:Methyltransferase type 11 n=1 Tax=Polynucleobacter asymbioticus (strain DSM 18221 / CIP 109841 / QLW-P1DMWA-1) TaxID=312153 RepID=A4SVM7_POLAQ|nr:glycoside hydrolase family 99-like domain-containing protein [Polynucleobacter asymbioticus]ABP33541.1 Methyltransferase type 11 [Polynucleobacter asymbioticus QLW-P1DMWA-1]